MTDLLTTAASTRIVDARGSFCPGPLMELIRAIRESAPGQVIAVYSSDSGSKLQLGELKVLSHLKSSTWSYRLASVFSLSVSCTRRHVSIYSH